MLITHKLSLDLMQPGTPQRIQVKQGDSMSHTLEILLYSGGEPWIIPGDVTPLLRWRACDLSTGKTASGIYDTLPGGGNAWNCSQNQLDLIPVPQMFALPGVVRCDVVLVQGKKVLATFDFEFYVNRAPVNSTEPQVQDYYKVATLEQINSAISALQEWVSGTDQLLAHLEHEVEELKRIVFEL
jgi:hypothetical protein